MQSTAVERNQSPKIGIIMGSKNDLEIMSQAGVILKELEIPHEFKVLSAHRTPDLTADYAEKAENSGLEVIIAGAGAAAALPGVVAAKTHLPVIGVPLAATSLGGFDALLSMAQMPGGVPVATVAIGKAGAKNAALLAARMLALKDPSLNARLKGWIKAQTEATARNQPDNV